jgi:hypothetical protein
MIRTIHDNCYVDTRPRQEDRSNAPLSDVEAFLSAQTFLCDALHARITVDQCDRNRKLAVHADCGHPLYRCQKCTAHPALKRQGRKLSGWQRDNERGRKKPPTPVAKEVESHGSI